MPAEEVKERESQTHAIGALRRPLSRASEPLSVELRARRRERRLDKERPSRCKGGSDKEEDSWYLPAAVERVQCRGWSKKAVGEKRSVGRPLCRRSRFRALSLVGIEPCGPPAGCCYSCFVFLFRLQSLSIRTGRYIAIAWAG